MKHAFFIWSGKIEEGDFFHTCLKSLQNVSDCQITIYSPELTAGEKLLNSMNINLVKFDEKDWTNRRLICKAEKAREFLYTLKNSS